jgi:hypothetical protein
MSPQFLHAQSRSFNGRDTVSRDGFLAHWSEARWRGGLRALAVAALFFALASCDDLEVLCAGVGVGVATVPQQLTLAPGDSAIVTASLPAKWTQCGETMTFRQSFTWASSNAAVATITPIDSVRVRVFGVARGQTTIVATSVDDPHIRGASAVVVAP